jgi:hypothetical protein
MTNSFSEISSQLNRSFLSRHTLQGNRACCSPWSQRSHWLGSMELQACPLLPRAQCRCGSLNRHHKVCCTCSRDQTHLGRVLRNRAHCTTASLLRMQHGRNRPLHSEHVCSPRTKMSSHHHRTPWSNATRLTTRQSNGQGMHLHCRPQCGLRGHSVGILHLHKVQVGRCDRCAP